MLRVRIAACGINFADTLMVAGTYQDMPSHPFALGMELAGTVDAAGPGTAGPAPGTRVAVFAGSGGLAEYGVFPVDRCLPLPDAMPFDIAAGFQVAYGTSHLALTRRARLAPGETLAVLGAAGGVGLTAVEIGAALGARVIAVARGANRLAAARAAGATVLIDSDATPDLTAALRAEGGVDVLYDPIGGPAAEAALRAVRPEGRMLVIGFASGAVPALAANRLMVKNIDVIGFYWGGYMAFRPAALHQSLSALVELYIAGRLSPQISHRLPLSRAAAALDLLRDRKAVGKVVVTIADL
jgi:NADPH2:quinone reductase